MNRRHLGGFILLVLIAGVVWLLPVEKVVLAMESWVEQHPGYAFLAVTGVTALAMQLMLPASLTMMLAGFLLGLVQGMAAVLVISRVAGKAFRAEGGKAYEAL